MKKEKRIKKELTSKQAKRYTALIVGIMTIIMIILTIVNWSKIIGEQKLIFVILILGIPTFGGLCCYEGIFKGSAIEYKEDLEKSREQGLPFLSKEKFTEVFFTPEDCGSETEMILGILEKIDCKFFAKLAENDDVILIAKDKNNEEIWQSSISNYIYFNVHFKIDKN